MSNKTVTSLTHQIDFDAAGMGLVCTDPATGQSLRFEQFDGRQRITYSFPASGTTREVVLTEHEAAELNAWRNDGRRSSYWDWAGWSLVRERIESM